MPKKVNDGVDVISYLTSCCIVAGWDNATRIREGELMEVQSGVTHDVNIRLCANEMRNQNITFSDEDYSYMYDIDGRVDPTRRLQDTDDASLENFFSRPIKISEEEWGTGTTLSYSVDPWESYWQNKRVINRISNYKLLRATMHVKVVINGNGFQYGRLMVSYQPQERWDTLSGVSGLIREDLVQLSQMPHIFLDPTTSTGGSMKLPFFHYENYLDIVGTEWSRFGKLHIRTLNELKHANGASDKVTVSIFAWAEDVSFNVLTSNSPDQLTPQSGVEIDEGNKHGVISGPATKVAKAAGMLENVPYIGPFASATSMAAGLTSDVAKVFGYCRPPVTKNPEPYRPTPMSSLAVTNVPDTAQKLTVDDKQELTIDPRISGIGAVDVMNIKEIARRESYLTNFSWTVNTDPDTLLWNARVDPCIWAESGSAPTAFHFPACAFAALPFKYWTGTMKFRFQVVSSHFHKGRLRISYDPEFLANTDEYNVNYSEIVDISEKTDFTIEIGNGQETTLLKHNNPGVNSVTTMYGTNRFTSAASGNGVLAVSVVNELTVPNSTVNNDIEINVFVSMGDDFEVFVPDDHFMLFTPAMTPQDGMEVQSGEEPIADEENAPQQNGSDKLGPGIQRTELINQVFTGESIASFRTMLKRYNLHSSIASLDTVAINFKATRPMFPLYRGGFSSGVDTTNAGNSYNYVNTIMLHWVSLAFSGRRGGIRYKLVPGGQVSSSTRVEVQRQSNTTLVSNNIYHDSLTSRPVYGSNKAGHVRAVATSDGVRADKPTTGALGTVIALTGINGVLEFEIPYYSRYRFTPGKPIINGIFESPFDIRIDFGASDLSAVYDVYAAAAEDFQVYFFTGLPRMYYEPIPPP
mgnify:FL=1